MRRACSTRIALGELPAPVGPGERRTAFVADVVPAWEGEQQRHEDADKQQRADADAAR